MTRGEIGDELLTLLAAGHETTASTLAWAFERLSRHPEVLGRLVAEADTEDNGYRQATIFELQRNRTVIDFIGRHVQVPMYELGEWRVPQGYSIMVSLSALHENPDVFDDPERFDPQRFVDDKPNTFAWVPFGGGTRRCVGAAFANMEMDVVLRTDLAALHDSDDDRTGGEAALPRRRLHAGQGRPRGDVPPCHPDGLTAGPAEPSSEPTSCLSSRKCAQALTLPRFPVTRCRAPARRRTGCAPPAGSRDRRWCRPGRHRDPRCRCPGCPPAEGRAGRTPGT